MPALAPVPRLCVHFFFLLLLLPERYLHDVVVAAEAYWVVVVLIPGCVVVVLALLVVVVLVDVFVDVVEVVDCVLSVCCSRLLLIKGFSWLSDQD